MKNKILIPILLDSCIIFTPLSLIVNAMFAILFIGDEGTHLPSIAINLLFLIISLIASLFIILIQFKLKKPYISSKIYLLYFICSLYTITFITVNLSTILLKNIWNIYTILIIFAVSIISGMIKAIIPIKSFLFKLFLYFILYAIPYFFISIKFGNFGENNMIIVLISVYIGSFAIISLAIYIIKSILSQNTNNNKEYQNLFKH